MWLKNEQEDELQIMLPCEPQMVKSKYDSYDDYMYTMWPLILIEFFAQVRFLFILIYGYFFISETDVISLLKFVLTTLDDSSIILTSLIN